jgi:hypothetical protein
MNYVEIALILVVAWSLVLLVDFLQSKDMGPLGFRKSAGRVFHSYWLSLIIYETLFIVSYGLSFYYWVLLVLPVGPSALLIHACIEWPVTYVIGVVCVWMIVRDRTDEEATIKREITRGLRAADSLEQYLEPILERISANPELDHSKHTLSVLRVMVLICDSRGAAIGKSLEKHKL